MLSKENLRPNKNISIVTLEKQYRQYYFSIENFRRIFTKSRTRQTLTQRTVTHHQPNHTNRPLKWSGIMSKENAAKQAKRTRISRFFLLVFMNDEDEAKRVLCARGYLFQRTQHFSVAFDVKVRKKIRVKCKCVFCKCNFRLMEICQLCWWLYLFRLFCWLDFHY